MLILRTHVVENCHVYIPQDDMHAFSNLKQCCPAVRTSCSSQKSERKSALRFVSVSVTGLRCACFEDTGRGKLFMHVFSLLPTVFSYNIDYNITIWTAQPTRKFFVRSLGPLPQTHEEKIANGHTVPMRQCTKKSTLIKVIFDRFSYNDENTTSSSGPRSPR